MLDGYSRLASYLVGATSARTGDEMSGPALLLLGMGALGSTATASGVVACLTVASAVGGPLVGMALDRTARPGRLLAAALAGYAVGLAVIALVLRQAPTALLFLLAFFVGMLGPVIAGGWTAQLPLVVGSRQVQRASAFDSASFTVASLIGPAVVGLIASVLDVVWAMLAAIAVLLLAVPVGWSLPARATEPLSDNRVRTNLCAGVGAILRNRALLRVTATSAVSYGGFGMLIVACPLVGQHLLGGSARGALLLSLLAVGALVAKAALAVWSRPIAPDTMVLVTTLLFALGLFLLAVANSAVGAFLAIVLVGIADGPQLTALLAVRHREAPDRVRGQVFTTAASIKIAAMALGTSLAGVLLGQGVGTVLLVACAVELLAAVTFLFIRPDIGRTVAASTGHSGHRSVRR